VLNPATQLIYLSVNGAVLVFDAASNTLMATIPVSSLLGGSYDGQTHNLAIDATTNHIYAATNGAGLAVIDGGTNSVVTTLSTTATYLTLDPATHRLYAASQSFNQAPQGITVLDTRTNTQLASIPMSWGSGQIALAVNPTTNKLYAAENGEIQVVDLSTLTRSLPIPVPFGGSVSSMAVDPISNSVYLTDGAFLAAIQ
jgi:hypothetical protein